MARTLVASDDFAVDGDVGSDWTYVFNRAWSSAPPTAISGTLRSRSNAANSQVIFRNDVLTADQYARIVIGGLVGLDGGTMAAALVRCSGDADARTYYAAIVYYWGISGSTPCYVQLALFTPGGAAELYGANHIVANGDTVDIEAEGTTIRLIIAGVVVAEVMDATIATGKGGIIVGGDLGIPMVDYAEFGNITGSGGGGGGGGSLSVVVPFGTGRASLSGLRASVRTGLTADALGAEIMHTAAATTDAGGAMTLDLGSGTGLTAGDNVGVLVSDGNGTTTQSPPPLAFFAVVPVS